MTIDVSQKAIVKLDAVFCNRRIDGPIRICCVFHTYADDEVRGVFD